MDACIDILHRMGHHLGLTGLAFDDSGFCILPLPDMRLCFVWRNPETNTLALYADLGPVQEPAALDMLRAALSFNHVSAALDDPVIALDADTDTLFLIKSFHPEHLPSGGEIAVMERFRELYRSCSGGASSLRESGENEPPARLNGGQSPNFA